MLPTYGAEVLVILFASHPLPPPGRKARVRPGRGDLSATLGVLFLRLDGLGLGACEGFTDPSHFRRQA